MLAACVALGATACGRHVHLGSLADGGDSGGGDGGGGILWQATFEPGDLSEWIGDGNGGIYMDARATAPAASADVSHRGRFSGVAGFAPMGLTSWSYLYRDQPSPSDAYYGAWFYIPATVQIGSWLSLHHFGYRAAADAADTMPVWDFHVYPTADGSLAARLYESSTIKNFEQTAPVPVPLATWVHFEILYRKAADATGGITAWQDGVQILDLANALTAPTEWVQWDAGGGSNDITPVPAFVYIDDATISLSRVGTGL
ncbi:MAG TPA: hypothetical protein VN903_39230 [Polyangia bacterium]|jgi:hypothetical protein|nr:hypothetical protein [Polyangia bacterium]